MADRLKNNHHTGKTSRGKLTEITLDSNMVGYLHLLEKGELSANDYFKMQQILTNEQYSILKQIIHSGYEGIKFYTTPQVIREVSACAKVKGDNSIVEFLERICKIKIPMTRADKERYADFIIQLMEEYIKEDVPVYKDGKEVMESAIASERKNGVLNFADAKIVAENTVLHGSPVVTRNEKHLISMPGCGYRNNERSCAILDKNKKILKSSKVVIPHKRIKVHLKSDRSTTFRINEIPDLLMK